MPSKRKFHDSRKAAQHVQNKKQKRSQFEVSGANALPVKSRLARSESAEQTPNEESSRMNMNEETTTDGAAPPDEKIFLADHFARAIIQRPDVHSSDLSLPPPPPPPILSDYELQLATQLSTDLGGLSYTVNSTRRGHDETVTDGPGKELLLDLNVQERMYANGNHSIHRHQQPSQQPLSHKAATLNDVAPFNTGLPGLMHSHIQVAKPFVFHQAIEGCLHDLGVALPREDNIRLAGVQWIDNVRRALKLYVEPSLYLLILPLPYGS